MFCKECGREIPNDSQVCMYCGVPTGTGSKFFPNCGSPASAGASFCQQCGQRLEAPARQTAYQQPGAQENAYQQPYQQQTVYQPVPISDPTLRSKTAAGILGILLGALGVHNFYLGYTGRAVAQLLISILSCGILSWASAIWGLVEGIMVLTGSITVDGQGRPLRD